MNNSHSETSKVPLRDRLACHSCAKAKTRCSWQTTSTEICERCARLKKQCNVQEKVPRKRKAGRTSRAAQLESKLDSIVGLLSTSQRQQLGYPTPDSPDHSTGSDTVCADDRHEDPPSPYGRLGSIDASDDSDDMSTADLRDPFFLFPGKVNSEPAYNPAKGIKSSIAFNINPDEAKRLLNIFKQHLAPHCPFVVLPPKWTPQDFKETRPFLYMTVILVSSYQDRVGQAEQAKEVIKYFSEHVLVWGERNLDLLQGMIVYLSWYHAFSYVFLSQQITNLHALCVSLCIDLCLNKAPVADQALTTAINIPRLVQVTPPPHTTEQKRALAGTFFLTSMVASCFQRIESMSCTDYVKECCRSLESAMEHPSDKHLVERVRLQLIIDEIYKTRDGTCNLGSPIDPRISTHDFFQHFHGKLQPFRALMSSHLQNNLAFMLHYYHAEICLYEIGLNPLPSDPANPSSALRIDTLQSCLKAVQSFVGTFFTIPSPMFFNLSYSTFARITHAMVTTAKLTQVEDIPWFHEHAKDTMDLCGVLEHAAATFEQAQNEARKTFPGGLNNEVYNRWSMRIRLLKKCFEEDMLEKVKQHQQPQQQHQHQHQQPQQQQQQVQPQNETIQTNEFSKVQVGHDGLDSMLVAPSFEGWPLDASLTGGFLDFSDEAFWREVAANPMAWANM